MTTANAAPTGAMTLPTQFTRFQYGAFRLGSGLSLHCLTRGRLLPKVFARMTSAEKAEAKQWPGDREERVAAASLPNSKSFMLVLFCDRVESISRVAGRET